MFLLRITRVQSSRSWNERPTRRKWDEVLIADMHRWMLEKCDKVVQSPNARDTIRVRDPSDPTKWITLRKHFYTFSVREIWLQMTKPVADGGWEHAQKGKGKRRVISQAFVAAHLPRNLSRMTESQKELCGCTVCIDAKGFIAALRAWRKTKMNHLASKIQQARRNHESDSVVRELKDEYISYKRLVTVPPPEGTPLDKVVEKPVWDSINVPMGLLTCPGPQGEFVKDKELCHLACALGRCPNCPKALAPFPHESTTWDSPDIDDHDFCVWREYGGRYFCVQHGYTCGKTSICQPCIDNPKEKPDSRPRRKVHYCRERAPIGTFMTESLIDLIDRYRYHKFLMIILGSRFCVKYRTQKIMPKSLAKC
jgi:hypothetical protein